MNYGSHRGIHWVIKPLAGAANPESEYFEVYEVSMHGAGYWDCFSMFRPTEDALRALIVGRGIGEAA
jgi:hypothetical protein